MSDVFFSVNFDAESFDLKSTSEDRLFGRFSYGRYGVRHNGAFELRFFNWIFSLGDPTGTPNLIAAARAASNPADLKFLNDHIAAFLR